MRALRDFNLPKIVVEDKKIFTDLIADLFPNLNPPRAVNQALNDACQNATIECGLQDHPEFV
jgi:dynein heavy chain